MKSITQLDSDISTLTCGVPQGSILGSLLFVLYVNDINSVYKNLFTLLFADGTSAFIEGDYVLELKKILNDELICVY